MGGSGRGFSFRQAGGYLSVVKYQGLLRLRQVGSILSIIKYRGFRLGLVFYSSLEFLYLCTHPAPSECHSKSHLCLEQL